MAVDWSGYPSTLAVERIGIATQVGRTPLTLASDFKLRRCPAAGVFALMRYTVSRWRG
jgi:hypothetical protein